MESYPFHAQCEERSFRGDIRRIDGHMYYYQSSWDTKAMADRAVRFYRGDGRLSRRFKRMAPSRKEMREHGCVGGPSREVYDVYATGRVTKPR